MNNIQKMKQDALDSFVKSSSRIDKAIDQLRDISNPFDIEAKVYFIRSLADGLEKQAAEIVRAMHIENCGSNDWNGADCLSAKDEVKS